jgi:hypothetical protein
MGVTDLEVKPTLALPLPAAPPLILTPGFGAHLFDGPVGAEVPAHTFDTYLDIRWMSQVTSCIGLDLAVTPGWYSDWEQSDSDAFRLGGRAVALYTHSPAWQFAIGAVYLDREDVPVLPLGGVIYLPHPDLKYELILPRPKIARRVGGWGCQCSDPSGTWVYVAGEFGGGSWAFERSAGNTDVLNYSDWRLLVGLERIAARGLTTRVEAGYVFSREIEYNSDLADVELDDTFLIRGEVSY